MVDFWVDTDSYVSPSRGPYRFALLPQFWAKLEELAQAGIIASPDAVFEELNGYEDSLEEWSIQQRDTLFLPASVDIQSSFNQVIQGVQSNPRFKPHHIAKFSDGADPWLIAYAMSLGGRIVTFEKPEPHSTKPKIPDVAGDFGIQCIQIYDMLSELNIQF